LFSLDQPLDFPNTELDVLAAGEVLVDIISSNPVPSFKKADSFNRYFGGSPANIAVNTSNLGASSALISKVGTDGLGAFLQERLAEEGVNTTGVIEDPD
jgi:fructokinase